MKTMFAVLTTLVLANLALGFEAAPTANPSETVRTVGKKYCQAFEKGDGADLANLYIDSLSKEHVFSDPVFGALDSIHTKVMWKVLLAKPINYRVRCRLVGSNSSTAFLSWTASYTYSQTRRDVVNRGKTLLRIEDDKIVQQMDSFDHCEWTKQALGDTTKAMCKSPGKDALRAKLTALLDSYTPTAPTTPVQ